MSSTTHTYIEVVNKADKRVIHRIDVTGKSERAIDRVDDGLNINLNHVEYFTRVKQYDSRQTTRL